MDKQCEQPEQPKQRQRDPQPQPTIAILHFDPMDTRRQRNASQCQVHRPERLWHAIDGHRPVWMIGIAEDQHSGCLGFRRNHHPMPLV